MQMQSSIVVNDVVKKKKKKKFETVKDFVHIYDKDEIARNGQSKGSME